MDSLPWQEARPPCAACKQSKMRCQPGCVFASVFPQNQSEKFMNVHRVYGSSNVGKLLAELQPHQRADAADSLAYEAEMRLRDPVFGSVGIITLLQQHLQRLQLQLKAAKVELSRYQSTSNRGLRHGAVAGGSRQVVAQGVIKDAARSGYECISHEEQTIWGAVCRA